ncbi:STAS/SEC14 domain-containing protein [uncultured Desulfosarcina sp.]|uniref:STAS/SEC14 domain-containing protein n=1 Tax=uncultured Desulfosarcina sp. TaxID=218289 RepID=UPI0029C6DEBD|nr:STAS/SEC14 domain-containing protein [uncultured Desulfosarcina sp.]
MPIGFDEIQVDQTPVGTIVTLKFREKLDKADYETFVPMIESQMQNGSPIRLLTELHDFEGWTAGALWEDTKFAAKHFNDIERLAVVGESRWQKGVTVFVKPFTSADVRYFDMKEVDKAREWIREA